jgi:type II secretory pathway component PulF
VAAPTLGLGTTADLSLNLADLTKAGLNLKESLDENQQHCNDMSEFDALLKKIEHFHSKSQKHHMHFYFKMAAQGRL